MAPTLLFLPGTLCDARVWDATMRALAGEATCAVVDYRFEESIAAMAGVALAAVAGPLIPIGLSMGGMVALEIWRQAAQRVVALALFGTDPGADTALPRARRDARVLRATHGEFRAMVEDDLVPSYFSSTRATEASPLETAVAMALAQGVGAFAAQATALATRPDCWALLERIAVPGLIACGSEDRICLPESHERMAARMPMAKLAIIANAGHLAPLEQPAAAARLLRDLMRA